MRRLLNIVIALLLSGFGASSVFAFTNSAPISLQGLWEYRWGDSPVLPEGELAWAQAEAGREPWKQFDFPGWAPDRPKGEKVLWQRIHLPDQTIDGDPAVLLRGAKEVLEAYLDGKRIFASSDWGAFAQTKEYGFPYLLIPLPADYAGKHLVLRIASNVKKAGVSDFAYLGAKEVLLAWILKRDALRITLSFLFIISGILSLIAYVSQRQAKLFLSFSLMAGSVGIYDLTRTLMKQVFLDAPLFWYNLELLSLFAIPIGGGLFVDEIIGKTTWRISRRLGQVSAGFLFLSVFMRVCFGQPLVSWLLPFQIGLLASLGLILSLAAVHAYRGNVEARIFLSGFVVMAAGAVYDLLIAMGPLAGQAFINHYVVGFFLLALLTIVMRRLFIAVTITEKIELARTVQNLLLPAQLSGRFAGHSFVTHYEPLEQMSGDWLNYWDVGTDEKRLIFGDVIGKGPQAALAVTAVAAILNECKRNGLGMEQSAREVHRALTELFGRHVGTTFAAACIRTDGRLDLYNCGGNGWMVVEHSGARHHLMSGSILGIADEVQIGHLSLTLTPGAVAFACTDGVLDGTKAAARLVRILRKEQLPAVDVPLLLRHAAVAGKDSTQKDDQTLVFLRHDQAA